MTLTSDEAAAIALAFDALRAQAVTSRRPARSCGRWSARSSRDLDGFETGTGRAAVSRWTAAARREAIRSDV